jgi:hypothetical protein
VGGAVAGLALSAGGEAAELALALLRIGLASFAVLALVVAAIRGGHGGAQGLERLLLLPVSRRALHRLAAASFLAAPWLMVLVPCMVALAAASAGRGVAAALVTLAAGLLYLAAVGALCAALAHAVRLLFRDRRRAELVVVVVLLVLMAVSIVPGLLAGYGARESPEPVVAEQGRAPEAAAEPAEEPAAGDPARLAVAGRFPWLLQPLPSEAAVRAIARATGGAPLAAFASLAVLVLVSAAGWELSRRAWERLLGSPAAGGRRGAARLPVWRRVRWVEPGPLAVAEAFARSVLRTVQGRVALMVPAVIAAALSVLGRTPEIPLAPWLLGPLLLLFVVFVGLSSNQSVLLNQFGVDRGGLTRQLLLPLDGRQLVAGHALGCAVLTAMAFAPALVLVALFGGDRSAVWAAATLLASVAAFALSLPFVTWVSLTFPKAADLGKLGSEGKPPPAAALVGILGLGLVMVPPAGAALAGSLAAGEGGVVAAEAVLAALALSVLRPLLGWTASLLERRREALYLALREG